MPIDKSEKKVTYLSVRPKDGGQSALMLPAELLDMIDDGESGIYEVRVVRKTAEEYEKLPEFEGW